MEKSNSGVIVKNEAGFKTEITSGRHSLIADESVKSGGTDAGVNPYDLLLSALGSCKAMTLRMYARRKNIPLKKITIKLSHHKVYADDCLNSESGDRKIDEIDVEISMTGELDEQQRKRLLEISEMCPVHRTLMNENKIITTARD